MLYDGLPVAIKNIRLRKELTQEKVASRTELMRIVAGDRIPLTQDTFDLRAGMAAKVWSKYETGTKKLTAKERSIVLDGLACTATELWEEKVEVERLHYLAKADQISEPTPAYGSPRVVGVLHSIYGMNIEELPASERQSFNEDRVALGAALGGLLTMVGNLKKRYRELKHRAS